MPLALRSIMVSLAVLTLVACQPGVKASKDGALLWDATCAQCHAHTGQGDPVWKARLGVPDLTDPAVQARYSDAQIFDTIKNGSQSRKMPPWGGVYSDEQIRALTAHVRTLKR